MAKSEKADLIGEYVQLRDRLSDLYREVTVVDQRLVELEYLLPEKYVYPGDLPESWTRRRRKPLQR
ncbi:MAG: hypothetical protein LLF97_09465 [Planctomycetaceae bacterium]|nr:hypothetical protein [Planctomycetaceae bacterium]